MWRQCRNSCDVYNPVSFRRVQLLALICQRVIAIMTYLAQWMNAVFLARCFTRCVSPWNINYVNTYSFTHVVPNPCDFVLVTQREKYWLLFAVAKKLELSSFKKDAKHQSLFSDHFLPQWAVNCCAGIIKGIVHPKMKIWCLSAYPKGIQDVGDFVSSVEHKLDF